jgi:anti-anti-sigma factor
VVVAVHGEVDLATVPELRAALSQAVGDAPAVLVDLCGCTFMDSSGLQAIIVGRRQAAAADMLFEVACGPGGAARVLFDLVLPDVLVPHASREDALAVLKLQADSAA